AVVGIGGAAEVIAADEKKPSLLKCRDFGEPPVAQKKCRLHLKASKESPRQLSEKKLARKLIPS
ncbi:hypothetical protein N8499_03655, partial [Akkermansiaceae bacterium]|nr:hypothetical protein [Akkermansiaceae bacterium]